MKEGVDFGLLSEAGLPCIGDPGNIIVGWSHKNNVKVIPINGPSSFVLALIASGFNGQQFSFNGYLAIEKDKKKKEIQQLERLIEKTGFTQIFMETKFLNPNTKLCIASNINDPENEFIQTKNINDWKKNKPELHKIPTVFLIGK